MTLLNLGVSYRTTAFYDLEQVSIGEKGVREVLPRLFEECEVEEVLVLSTCNRMEVFAWTPQPEVAVPQVGQVIEHQLDLPEGWFCSRALLQMGDDAVRHLFLVTAGLDSMVAGEPHIQGQVRDAYRLATEMGTVGSHLHMLMRTALQSGKRARSSTKLAEMRRSLPAAGVDAISTTLGGLEGRTVLMVGAGKMAKSAIDALVEGGATVEIAARRQDVARDLVPEGATVLPIEAADERLLTADAIVYATAAPHVLIDVRRAQAVVEARKGSPLVLLDLGMPRNVDARIASLPGAVLFDLDALHRQGYTAATGWEGELTAAKSIAHAKAEEALARLRAKTGAEFAARLHDLAIQVADDEAERAMRRIPDLDEDGKEAIAQAVNRAVRKLLHLPTVRGKEAAARGDEAVLEAAQWLFGLEAESSPPTSRVSVEGWGAEA